MIHLQLREAARSTPEIEAWLRETERQIQPIIDKAIALWWHDLSWYGVALKTPEEYIEEAMR